MSYQDTLNKIIRDIGKNCAEKWQAFDADSTELRVDFGGLYSTWHEAAVDEAELREFCYAYAERFPDDAEFQEDFEIDVTSGAVYHSVLRNKDFIVDIYGSYARDDMQALFVMWCVGKGVEL